MEEKYNEATINRPEGDRPVDAPVVLIDIPDFIKQLKKEKAWDKNDRNAITVFKSDKMRVILVAMHKKAEMTTEHPENIFSLQVIDGKVKLHTSEKTIEVREEQLFVLHANIPYKVEALKKSIFLLTVVESTV
jgi:quercetin dioxygenase-like cupin family protein